MKYAMLIYAKPGSHEELAEDDYRATAKSHRLIRRRAREP